MDIQFFSNQFESTPVLSSHRLSCIHSYSTLIHSFFSYHFIPLLVISLYLSSITLPSVLVLTNNAQMHGVDYEETFAPVVKMTTVRTVIALATTKGNLHQTDVKNTFLQGELKEVYMVQLHGFKSCTHPTTTCPLKKPLYGLKKTPLSLRNGNILTIWQCSLHRIKVISHFQRR